MMGKTKKTERSFLVADKLSRLQADFDLRTSPENVYILNLF